MALTLTLTPTDTAGPPASSPAPPSRLVQPCSWSSSRQVPASASSLPPPSRCPALHGPLGRPFTVGSQARAGPLLSARGRQRGGGEPDSTQRMAGWGAQRSGGAWLGLDPGAEKIGSLHDDDKGPLGCLIKEALKSEQSFQKDVPGMDVRGGPEVWVGCPHPPLLLTGTE